MSQNSLEGSTHTGAAFRQFVIDLLGYVIPKYGYEWQSDSERSFKKIFKESFGDAVILFRSRHQDEFDERFLKYFDMEMSGDILSYSDHFCQRTFQGKLPLMELIAYCAFLLDCTMFHLQVDDLAEVHRMINQAFGVFRKYVKPFFTIVGGWHALYQVAEQYVGFVNFTPASIVSESASEVASVSKL